MSGRAQPENGADSPEGLREYVDPRDYTCDYCARTYGGLLHQVNLGGSISWLCETCYQRQQDEYERLTRGAA